MKIQGLSLFIVFALLSALLAGPLTASAQSAPKPAGLPVSATGTAASGPVTFDGTFTIQRFRLEHGQLVAIGHLAGTLTETVTGVKTNVPERRVTLPVQSINGQTIPAVHAGQAEDADSDSALVDDQSMAMMEMAQAVTTCNILHLVLGPLNLNLLGLVVTLNQVTLNIQGATGPGMVLGNLLCALVGMPLQPPGALGTLVSLLNSLLAVLALGLP